MAEKSRREIAADIAKRLINTPIEINVAGHDEEAAPTIAFDAFVKKMRTQKLFAITHEEAVESARQMRGEFNEKELAQQKMFPISAGEIIPGTTPEMIKEDLRADGARKLGFSEDFDVVAPFDKAIEALRKMQDPKADVDVKALQDGYPVVVALFNSLHEDYESRMRVTKYIKPIGDAMGAALPAMSARRSANINDDVAAIHLGSAQNSRKEAMGVKSIAETIQQVAQQLGIDLPPAEMNMGRKKNP